MEQKTKYKTKQQEILLDYLRLNQGKHITAADAYEYLHEKGQAISKATIYRQLEQLVDEGILNKYIIDGNSPACFEYVDKESHAAADVCFHCKCKKCGKLIHLHDEELEDMQAHLLGEHSFRLDPVRTVFYGECENCYTDKADSGN